MQASKVTVTIPIHDVESLPGIAWHNLLTLVSIYNESREIHDFTDGNLKVIDQQIKMFCKVLNLRVVPIRDGEISVQFNNTLFEGHPDWK